MQDDFFDDFPVEFPDGKSSHIKVIGVGGGGCNVVAEISKTNPKDVDLIICNTDEQALNDNPVNQKIKLGSQKLGAGLDPAKGRLAAKSSEAEIELLFDEETEMVFVTACLGGGTGTGAAPVIAEIAKRKGKLVVGVVTKPFKDEGVDFMQRANDGLNELRKYVDSTILIDNQKLYEPYGDLSIEDAYSKVNEVLVTAVKGISDIVTISGKMNVDMNDVRRVLAKSGTATIGIGEATTEEGVGVAVEKALKSPLLNDCNFSSSKGAIVILSCDLSKTLLEARRQATETVQNFTGNPKVFKFGLYPIMDLADKVRVTVVISGFRLENVPNWGGENIYIDPDGKITQGDIDPGKIYKNEPTIEDEYIKRKGGEKPVLVIEQENELLALEEEPAYERKNKRKKERFGTPENSANFFTIKDIGNDTFFSTDNSFLHKTQD